VSIVPSAIIFGIAVALLAYIPGRLALKFARVSIAGLDSMALSLNLGLVISAIAFGLLSYFSAQQYFILYVLVGAGIFAYHCRKGWERPALSFEGPYLLLLGTILVGVALLAILPMYYSNMTLTTEGRMRVSPINDFFLHAGIANELTHSVPPQNPVFAGVPLSYHIGSHLAAAMFANTTLLNVADLTARFLPTLFLIITLLSVFCFAREWLFSGYGAALVTWLIFFGEDFSFIPGLLQGSKSDWSVQYFGVPSTFSLFWVNPILPALGLFFAILLCLAKAQRGDELKFKWNLLAGLLFAGLAECKILLGAHLGISLAVAGVVYLVVFRSLAMFQATIIAGFFSLPIAVEAFLLNRQSAQHSVTFFQSEWVQQMVHQLRLSSQLASLPRPAWLAIAVPTYLIGSMGLRAIGIPSILKDLLWPRNDAPLRFLLAIFIVVGAVVGLTVTLVPKGSTGSYNNAIWFYGQSKCVTWLFAVETGLRLLRRVPSIAQRAFVVACALAISIPSTVQHFTRVMSYPGSVLLPSAMDVLQFLRTTARPGETVLSPPDLTGPILATTKCHVLLGPYAQMTVPVAQLQHRDADITSFWKSWHRGVPNSDILRAYSVNYLVINKRRDSRQNLIPELTVVFENAEWLVYHVTPNQQPHRSSAKHSAFSGSVKNQSRANHLCCV
jgi:hypothetical protein